MAGANCRRVDGRDDDLFWILAALSLVAILFQTAPVLWFPNCGSLP
jgi:hypothetical protein